jgi:prolyl-tRNA editing enzyme YbaK/EbsC (Cys-tRNA(Pro) deacylase)
MVDKVVQAARELGLEIEILKLDRRTHTVAEAAEAIGVEPAQIAKSLVFVADGEPVLCVASGAHRVDIDTLADTFDCAAVRQATPDEVRAATGFSVGGVPPFGHDLPVVFDELLCEQDLIYAAGGDGNTLFATEPKALAKAINAKIVSVGETAAS